MGIGKHSEMLSLLDKETDNNDSMIVKQLVGYSCERSKSSDRIDGTSNPLP